MKKSSHIKIGLVITGASLLTGGAWWIGLTQGQRMVNPTAASGGALAAATPASTDEANPASGRRVLYWYDPMVPAQKFDRPGRSPYMDMALVPKYADDVDSMAGSVAVNPQVQQSLGIRTATVTSGPLNVPFEASGTVAYNEREATVVSTRVAGTVERLLVRAPLDSVQRGQAVAELFVPEWLAAQEEFLAVRKLKDADGNYLWRPGGAGEAASLLGYAVTEIEDMPDIAANSFSIGFGDFRRGYLIVDRQGARVLRDPYSLKPYVLFYTTKRVGGGVQNFDAIKVMKFAAS